MLGVSGGYQQLWPTGTPGGWQPSFGDYTPLGTYLGGYTKIPPQYTTPVGGGGGGGGGSVASMAERAEEAYDPVFRELDRQLGILPSTQTALSGQVTGLATEQRGEAELGRGRAMTTLEQAERGEETRSVKSLRDLGESARGLLGAAANIWGDSSAVPAVTAGVTKAVTRERGDILSQRNESMRILGEKKVDVENIFNSQLQKIETWKNSQLVDIAEWVKQREGEIRSQKADIQANLRMELLNWTLQRMSALDSAAVNYRNSIDQWKLQRQGELEDYERKLQLAQQYGGGQYGYELPAGFTYGPQQELGGQYMPTMQQVPTSYWDPETQQWQIMPYGM